MTLMPILAAAAAEAAQPAGDNPFQAVAKQFGWEPQLFISQLVLFVLVAAVLAKFAYKPLLAMLEMRRQQIAESLQNAEKTRQELANAQAKAQEILAQAGAQANKIIEETRAAAAKIGEQERQKAVAESQQILAKAHEAGEAELARLKGELRKEFGRLVVQAAAQSTGNILTPDQKGRLAEDAVKQLAA
jgi:F-type H+-transporting ATPase subunit b